MTFIQKQLARLLYSFEVFSLEGLIMNSVKLMGSEGNGLESQERKAC